MAKKKVNPVPRPISQDEIFPPTYVKQCMVGKKVVYGITDGTRWFVCAYHSRERALAIKECFKTALEVRVNICHPAPLRIEVIHER